MKTTNNDTETQPAPQYYRINSFGPGAVFVIKTASGEQDIVIYKTMDISRKTMSVLKSNGNVDTLDINTVRFFQHTQTSLSIIKS
ncbi:hypothetical protein ACX64O_26075 [Pseudomonas fitomaticsae]